MTTLSEVAELSGVSVATASRALKPRTAHMVSQERRERVLAQAERLGFRPNALAQGLRGSYFSTIGVVVHDIRDPYFAEAARAVADAAAAEGFLAVVCNSERDPDTELRYVRQMIDYKAAGMLFIGGGLEDASYRRRLAPLIRSIEGYGGAVVALGPRTERWAAEVPDNRGGAEIATRHLLSLGHRHIAFIDGPSGLRTSAERCSGYVDALRQAGVAPRDDLIVSGNYSALGGMHAMAELLDAGSSFTAVFASNDAMATGCLQELSRRGIRVPHDLSLIGFDDVPLMRWLAPPLTTISVPMAEIGAAGIRRLLDHLGRSDLAMDRRVNVHPCELVIRESTAPPLASRGRPRRRVVV